MDLAIIIPTFNGAGKLPILLGSLLPQLCDKVEVIVVDDGSTPPVSDWLPSNLQSPCLRILRIANSGRAGARNAGAADALAPILLFLDDDMDLPEGHLTRHLQFHESHAESILVGCPVPPVDFIEKSVFLKYRYQAETAWAKRLAEKGLFRCTTENFYVTTQCLSIAKATFVSLNGFDTKLKDSEDFDFGARAILANIPLFVDGQLKATHRDYSDLEKIVQRQREYYLWKEKLLQIHPEYQAHFDEHFKWKVVRPFDGVKRKAFSQRSIWKSIFASKWFAMLSDRIRFRFFSAYIYANSVIPARS